MLWKQAPTCVTPHHRWWGVIGASVLGCVMGDIVIDDILIDEHPLFPHNPIQPLCNHCVVGLSPCKRLGSTESPNLAAQHVWAGTGCATAYAGTYEHWGRCTSGATAWSAETTGGTGRCWRSASSSTCRNDKEHVAMGDVLRIGPQITAGAPPPRPLALRHDT